MRKIGVAQFPGTNCDRDCLKFAIEKGNYAEFLWHLDRFNILDYDLVIIPGGFSYGDYLRSGALAALSPVMKSIKEFAESGRPVIGICNGFQILTEAGLLPGSLVKNIENRFIDYWVALKPINSNKFFGEKIKRNIRLPVAHGDGRYFIDQDGLKKIQDNQQIWFRYEANPNG